MLPFEPEPSHALRARYLRAIEQTTDTEAIVFSGVKRPGELRTHVFDCEDGMRLIISRDHFPDVGPAVHFSVSFWPDSKIVQRINEQKMDLRSIDVLCRMRFSAISGERGVIRLVAMSTKGVLHYVVEMSCNSRETQIQGA